MKPDAERHVDVLVVGAGLSGIDAAYHLQTRCPRKTYEILEARDGLGGTWDLFRYPGIRSDSDMFTLGFPFRPWKGLQPIADGASILGYMRETAEAYGIDRKIRYGQRVARAAWSSRDARWTVETRDPSGATTRLTCGFLFACSGYYDYEQGYSPELKGREKFRGRVVHPQKWTPDVAYEGKRVVIIGSGATAVTLLPALARRAAHVTMLQRSPSYVVSVPEDDRLVMWLRRLLPGRVAYALARWKNVLFGMAFYWFCRRFPERAKRLLVGQVRKLTRGQVDVEAHFTPRYDPWDQRVCVAPDGDFFAALLSGRASVVTDEIDALTETGVKLRSGRELEADLLITATGLRLKFLGGVELEVDGRRIEPSRTMAYKGMMCSGVPNLALSIGYTNASWTLKCDLTSRYVCRLLNYMDRRGHASCCPRRPDSVPEEPLIDFTSGYVRRSIDLFPKQGAFAPWRLHQNYALDLLALGYGSLGKDMEFR